MTHTRIHQLAAGILAVALTVAIAIALGTTSDPASARTFSFNSAGSLVQQPLPPEWACDMSRALTGRPLHCGR
jgi:hypothetical protein